MAERFAPGFHYACRGRASPPPEGNEQTGNRDRDNVGNDMDREARDAFQNLAEGQHHVAIVLQQLSDTLQHISVPGDRDRGSRGALVGSHRSKIVDRQETRDDPTGTRDRPLCPTFLRPEDNTISVESEPSPFVDDMVAHYAE